MTDPVTCPACGHRFHPPPPASVLDQPDWSMQGHVSHSAGDDDEQLDLEQ